jgi:hypothetical protein
MKIALAFWGLTRSLKYTIDSIKNNVISKLSEHEITIFLHTFKLNEKYNNPRANEKNINLDFNEYKLLNPDFFEIDNQDEIKTKIDIKSYRSKPDPWKTNYVSVDNFICSMYSKSRVVNMIINSQKEFDYIIFLRPDVLFLTPLDNSFFNFITEDTICVPNFHRYGRFKFNDRFCISNFKNGLIYGDLFKNMLEYSKNNVLHSETFIGYYMNLVHKLKIKFINFYFNRVRADGRIKNDCQIKKK